MQGFKNLLPRQILADQAVQPLVKKTDQHRKITQTSLEHFFNIYRNIENFYSSFEQEVFELHKEVSETQNNLPNYYLELTQLFKNINVELRVFSEKTGGSYKELNSVCNALFHDYSNVVLNFQQNIRNYQSSQQILSEMSKKYTRNLKSMQSYLESYKMSFTDARLIYNNQQKYKRYALCESTYKNLMEDYTAITEKCDKLTEKKKNIKQNFLNIQREMCRTLKVVSSKIIIETKNHVKNFVDFQKTIITFLAQKKFSLEKLKIHSFFQSIDNLQYQQFFLNPINEKQCTLFPALFVYSQTLKDQYLPYCKAAFASYFKESYGKVQKRKQINRKVLQFLKLYVKCLQKTNYITLKEIIQNFEKIKKKLSELFGGRFVSFLKSIHAIFELSIGICLLKVGIHQKMLKTVSNKLKNIQSYIIEQNKQMQIFIKQLRMNIEKFIGKKQPNSTKRQDSARQERSQLSLSLNNSLNNSQILNQGKQSMPNRSSLFLQNNTSVIVDDKQFKNSLKQRSQFLIHLITGFVSKLEMNGKKIKENVNSIIHDFSMAVNQFYSLCCQYETIYFGNDEFMTNYKKYQQDINKTLEKQSKFILNELNFKILASEDINKVVFDGELAKIDQFKKIKKPEGYVESKNKLQGLQSQKNVPEKKESNSSDSNSPDPVQNKSKENTINNSARKSSNSQQNQPSKEITSGDKYGDFLAKKITFNEGQQFVKSFSCAFYDKIILQGRIYITNHRICFHSKFNPNNVFFGGTFIQIPKKDITKVEKRYNALIFDNSIALTTVNGQMFFTSFFSRDQAYDLMNKALEINLQEEFFEAQEFKQEQPLTSDTVIQQDDDLKPQQVQNRQQQITKMLQNFPYQTLIQSQIQVPNINAMKFFRLFDSGQEINHNRRTYNSFLQFCKQNVGHKEIAINHFEPNILEYLNYNNIKSSTPLKIERKLSAMVPISAAGVPFMPKAAKSEETQSLFFVSRDKYYIEATVQNSGAPYTDCFNVKLRRTICSEEQNRVKIKIEMHVNFIKSTMMKNMIESKALQQTKSFFSKMLDEVKKYFKNLEKAKKPHNNNPANKEEEIKSLSNQLQLTKKELQQLLSQKQTMNSKITTLTNQQQVYKKIIIGSVVFNLILLLILLS